MTASSSHHHGHHHHSGSSAPKAIMRAIWVTLTFMLIEFLGGIYSNSLALISDAAHMLTDVGALLLSLFALWMAQKPGSLKLSFGYHRAEILGALFSGLLIWLIAGFLIYESILRFQDPPEVQGLVVFVVATVGLIANLISMRILHPSKESSINVRAAYLHLLADCLGSIGAVIAGLVLWLTQWRPIDPIVTVFFSILMLVSSWSLVRESVAVLMESSPKDLDPDKIHKELEQIEGVIEVHDLHIWSVSTGKNALSVHLISKTKEQEILRAANQLLQDHFKIVHTTIQVEHPEEFQSDRCYDCVPVELRSNK